MTRIRGKTVSTWGKRSEWWEGTSKVDQWVAELEARVEREAGQYMAGVRDGMAWGYQAGREAGSSSEGERGRQAEGGRVEQGSSESAGGGE